MRPASLAPSHDARRSRYMLSDARSRTRLGVLAITVVATLLAILVAVPRRRWPATTTSPRARAHEGREPGVSSGRDVGFSVALPNGQALWIFGDTSTVEYVGNAWKMTHFIAGSSAAIGPYSPGQVPAPMTEVIVGQPHRADNQPARFVPGADQRPPPRRQRTRAATRPTARPSPAPAGSPAPRCCPTTRTCSSRTSGCA